MRYTHGLHAMLERRLPEQRLFLKSDTETRFVRLRPATQAVALAGGLFLLSWTIVATAILLMDSIGAGSGREQAMRQQTIYEDRLNALSSDRDARAAEAARAQARFNVALAQVSEMQAALLASEDQRKELETGIDVIQNTLRRTIAERDEARAQAATLLAGADATTTEAGRARDAVATLDVLAGSLRATARERDAMAAAVGEAQAETDRVALALRETQARNDAIFTRLEEAVTVSMDPLDAMFRKAGLEPEALLDKVRSGYSGQGGPLTPISISTSNRTPAPEEIRANAILGGLDRLNLYRIAVEKTPLVMPVNDPVRLTSPFGGRPDPFGRGARQHEGVDLAGPRGTDILATADGTVVQAGWSDGYGNVVKIRHDFGIETLYAHNAELTVSVGDRVSRGDKIAEMGSTGRSTGTHVHYEIRIGGNQVNPMTFIKAAKDVF